MFDSLRILGEYLEDVVRIVWNRVEHFQQPLPMNPTAKNVWHRIGEYQPVFWECLCYPRFPSLVVLFRRSFQIIGFFQSVWVESGFISFWECFTSFKPCGDIKTVTFLAHSTDSRIQPMPTTSNRIPRPICPFYWSPVHSYNLFRLFANKGSV